MMIKLTDLLINDEYYEAVPRPDEKSYVDTKKSIEDLGILVPLIINDSNVIIEGHTRYEIAKELGIEEVPVSITKFPNENEELIAVIELNSHRRQLTTNQAARLASKLFKLYEGRYGNRHGTFDSRGAPLGHSRGKSAELAGKKVGVGKSSVKRVRFVENVAESDDELVSRYAKSVLGEIDREEIGLKPAEAKVRDLVKASEIANDESHPYSELAAKVIDAADCGMSYMGAPWISEDHWDYDVKDIHPKPGNLISTINKLAVRKPPKDINELVEAHLAGDDVIDEIIEHVKSIKDAERRVLVAKSVMGRLPDPYVDDFVIYDNCQYLLDTDRKAVCTDGFAGFEILSERLGFDVVDLMDKVENAVIDAKWNRINGLREGTDLYSRLYQIVDEEEE